jgi:photosynthetic reaction center cytochrome c subunit
MQERNHYMKLGSNRTILGALATTSLCLLGVALAHGQARPEPKQPMAEKAFKNVKVLTGIPVDEFMATMGFFAASLSMNCTDCHVAESGGNWEKYADDTELKQTARRMIGMVAGINKTYFGGKREVTCYSCHRGGERPRITPSIAELYGPPPPPEEPDKMLDPAPKGPSADQVLDKYIQAIGGAQRLAGLTSFVAKGTQQGYADTEKHPVDLYAKAPNERTTIIHNSNGDSTTTYDGRTGWTAAPATDRPFTLLELQGGDLEGAKLDAALSFPTRLKQALTQWRVGLPTTIDDRDVQIVQGTSDGRYPVNLYFDSKSGLLVRVVRYTDSPVGLNPTQIDFDDYRDVAGVKMPFRWTVSWLDGRSTITLSDVQPNAPIDAAKFAKPAAPKSASR